LCLDSPLLLREATLGFSYTTVNYSATYAIYSIGSFAKFDRQGLVVRDDVFHKVGPKM